MNTAINKPYLVKDFSKSNIPDKYKKKQYTLLYIKNRLISQDQKETFVKDFMKLLNIKTERTAEYYIYKENDFEQSRDLKGYEIRVIADWLGIAISDVFTSS